MEKLNEAQKILQEQLVYGLEKFLRKDQKSSTKLRRTELTKDSVITKLGCYDRPNKFEDIDDKTCIVYRTALIRDYMRDRLGMYSDYKIFSYEEFASLTNSVIEIFINGRKIWFKNIEVRVRKDTIYLITPKIPDEIDTITIFELPEKLDRLSYHTENNLIEYPAEWRNPFIDINAPSNSSAKYPIAFNCGGYFNRITQSEIMPLENDDEQMIARDFNIDWDGKEFESYNLNCTTFSIDMRGADLINDKFSKAIAINNNYYSKDSIKVFGEDGKLLPETEYELELVFNEPDTNKNFYVFRTTREELYQLILHNNEDTQLNQFRLKNIISRYDKVENWLKTFNENYKSLPDFIKKFKNIDIPKNILDIRNDEERFMEIMKYYINHCPEWYNTYLDTISNNKIVIRAKDLPISYWSKYNNFDECESKFQRVDFGKSEHILLVIRNEKRSDNISIYMNGLKYLGIRNIVHSRNFTYIYLLKQALPEPFDIMAVFEIEVKDDDYYVFSHTAVFDGDAMIAIDHSHPKLLNFDGNIKKIIGYHNGRRLRDADIYYNKDIEGNHSFFFNIKTKKGDSLAVEVNGFINKEILFMNLLPTDGVINVIKNNNYRYPLSSKYYEIFINGRKINMLDEKFISNFIIQIGTIVGNHNISIYEKVKLDNTELNETFFNAKDDWDSYIREGKNIEKYKGLNKIIEEDPYNRYFYTLAQYRMHLFYWWFLVPRIRILDCNPFSKSEAPEVVNEIERLFPDFVDGNGTVTLDTHNGQTSVMFLGHGLEGYIANMLYVLDVVLPEHRPTDSSMYYSMKNVPYFKVENNTMPVDANVVGTPGLRIVPRLPLTDEEYETIETPDYSRMPLILDANIGIENEEE